MSRASLSGIVREEVGTSGLKGIRKDNFIPGVIYGHHVGSTPVKMDALELGKFLKYHGVGTNLDFTVGSVSHNVIIKEIQLGVMKGNVLHIDFQELQAGEKVNVTIPIRLINKEKIEDSRSVVSELIHEIEMSVLPKDLIDSIELDVAHLKYGENIKIKDLSIFDDERYDLSNDEDEIIVALAEAKVHEESEDEEAVVSSVQEDLSVL